MTTSGTYDFNPSLGELVLEAFARIGIRQTEVTEQHIRHATVSANLVLSEWSGLQPNLWEVSLQTTPLVQGTDTYTLPDRTVMILDLYISVDGIDRYIMPVSRTEYASYPNKAQQGFPTVYWFDRLISPTVTLWPVPDGNATYTMKFYTVRQTQDAVLSEGQTVEIPYRWLDAFAAALAWRLSEKYAPGIEMRMQQKAERAWTLAAAQDTENVPLYIAPGLSGYYR